MNSNQESRLSEGDSQNGSLKQQLLSKALSQSLICDDVLFDVIIYRDVFSLCLLSSLAEDIDPSIGRFRNLVQTTVIPNKVRLLGYSPLLRVEQNQLQSQHCLSFTSGHHESNITCLLHQSTFRAWERGGEETCTVDEVGKWLPENCVNSIWVPQRYNIVWNSKT